MSETEKLLNFIECEMDFYSYQDFYQQAEPLKKLFDRVDIRTKKLYKYYVYSRDIKYSQKNRIWDYLNNDISLGALMTYEKENKRKYNRRK